MKVSKWLLNCLVVALLLNSCDSIFKSNRDTYPTTLEPLSDQELQQKINTFHRSNDFHMCSLLNEFGLTIGKGCYGTDNKSNDALNKEEVVKVAKRALFKNRAYTNVKSVRNLRLQEAVERTYPGGREWKIDFHDQIFEDIKVKNTSITVWLNANGAYRIDGHWYRNVVNPRHFITSRSDALEAAIGYEINYSNWTGPNHLVITEEDLPSPEELELCILPYRSDGLLQLRVAWEFPVAKNFALLFVDTKDGTVLDHKQQVIF